MVPQPGCKSSCKADLLESGDGFDLGDNAIDEVESYERTQLAKSETESLNDIAKYVKSKLRSKIRGVVEQVGETRDAQWRCQALYQQRLRRQRNVSWTRFFGRP